MLSQFKKRKVRNAIWLTADVHYAPPTTTTRRGRRSPTSTRSGRFVAGPINAGTFGPNALDPTFGPKVVFVKAADFPNQPPSGGNQFFGHVDIDPRTGVFTASLRNLYGTVLWTKDIHPARH